MLLEGQWDNSRPMAIDCFSIMDLTLPKLVMPGLPRALGGLSPLLHVVGDGPSLKVLGPR